MITRDQLRDSIIRECDIAIHLFSKLPPGSFEYRPTLAQRSTLELLRYLAVCAIAGIHSMAAGNFKPFSDFSERVKDMPPEDFPAAMEKQKQEIRDYFEATSEETLSTQEAPLPGGTILPLGAAIMNGPLKWITAYKMQLFLYAKANGASELGTTNAWRGADRT